MESWTGGTQRTTYFTSTQLSKETGSIQPNDQVKASLRLNLSFAPNDKWTVEARSTYVRDVINEIQAGNNWTALLGNAINGDPRTVSKDRPYGEAWVPVSDIQSMTTQSDVDRWTGGLTLSHAPLSRLLWGEVRTGLLIGLTLAAAVFPVTWLGFHDVRLAFAITLAVFCAGAIATAVGLLLPWALLRLRQDPAFGSGPVATVIQDVLSLLIYLSLVSVLKP